MSHTEFTPLLSESPAADRESFHPMYMDRSDSPPQSAFFPDISQERRHNHLSTSLSRQTTLIGADPAETNWGEEKRLWISADSSHRGLGTRQRTLVLCFDGTGDQFDGDNSNVVQFLAMLKKDSSSEQLAGIGTYTDPLFSMPLTYGVSMALDQMLAWNLASHVKDGYAFLMQNYTQGDRICIFGFSRGAYTARALAGMLQKVGLLPLCNHQQLPFAYEMYVREDHEGLELSHMFKKTFCRSVVVEFLGVWDTVASVGIIPRYLPFIHENTGIRYLRHALALDERRVKFLPQFCVEPILKDEKKKHIPHMFKRKKPERAPTLTKAYEDLINKRTKEKPDVKEVWFAGVHTDVGGGSVPNGTRHSLARIPLRWMIRECFRCNTGLIFDAAQLQQAGLRVTMEHDKPALSDLPPRVSIPPPRLRPNPKPKRSLWSLILEFVRYSVVFTVVSLRRILRPKRGNTASLPLLDLDHPDRLFDQPEDYEVFEEYEDALSPFYDQLQARASWHLLEWIPQRVKTAKAIVQKAEDGDSYTWLWNRGRGRLIPKSEMKEGLKVHRSVKTRLEASERLVELYVPQVRPYMRRYDGFGRKIKKDPVPLTHEEWNVDSPKHWEWVE